MAKKPAKEIETDKDAWARFERAVDVVAKSPPQPKKSRVTNSKKPKKSG